MNLLAFDTSSSILSVALKKGSESISESRLVGFLTHAENLLPIIDDLLQKEKLSIHDVDAFLIGRGPGSFTGLRIGFATLKGFITFQKKPCYGALSLDMIAENVTAPEGSQLVVCLDARREKIYTKSYRRQDGQWIAQEPMQILSIDAFLKQLPNDFYLCGDALRRYGKTIQQTPHKKICVVSEDQWHPKATTLISFFEKQDMKIEALKNPKDWLPLYFQLSEAEEKTQDHVGHH